MSNLIKSIIAEGQISVMAIDSKDIVNQAIKLHNLSPVAAAALGRTLTFASMMGTTLKSEDGYLSIIINGDSIGNITVCANSNGIVKGFVDNPFVESSINAKGKLDVAKVVGTKGKLTIIKNNGDINPYIGTCQMVSGEIAEDLVQYYAMSEQQPCAIALGVTIDADGSCSSAGGLFVRLLPFCSEEAITQLESVLPQLKNISAEYSVLTPAELLGKYFGFMQCEIVDEYETSFTCDCSEMRMEKVLISLGKDELYDIVNTQGVVEIVCHFCNKKYQFDKNDIDKLVESL